MRKKRGKDNVGVEFEVSALKVNKEGRNILAEIMLFISYISGVIGILYSLSFSPFLNFKKILVYIISVFICSIIWTLYNSKKMKIVLTIFAVLLLFNIRFLIGQWQNIWELLLYNIKYLKNIDITETILIFSVVISFILYWLTFKKGKGWIIYLVSIAVIIIGPIIGNPPDIIQVCLFVFFHIGTSITGNMISSKKKKDKVNFELINNAGISALFTAIFFIFSLGVSYKINDKHMKYLFSIPVRLEEEIKSINTIWKSDASSEGKVSRGNNKVKGIKKLEVVVSEKPEEILYLKNFIGINYLDNKWEKDRELNYLSDETDSNGNKVENYNLSSYFDKGFSLVQNKEFENNQAVNFDSTINTIWLRVKHLTSENSGYYIPYISQAQRIGREEYTFLTYSNEKFLNAIKDIDSENYEWFKNMNQAEYGYIKDKYLNAEKERFPNLFNLCQDNYRYGEENVTEFIKDTLWSKASYTLSPGRMPMNTEIPEYFLFEGGKGYCVHFATTAVLMYRMYGIPARYVTGYIAKPSQFIEESGGTYKAILTDREAHAWVEIYKEDYGWERVEVTPSINATSSEVNVEKDTVTEERTNTITESVKEEKNIDNLELDLNNNNSDSNKNWQELLKVIKVLSIIIVVLISIIGSCYIIKLRRKKIIRKYKKSYSDTLVTKIVEVLQFGGYIKDYTGMEEDFPKVISNIVPKLTNEEAEKIIKYAFQESFGNRHVSPKNTKETWKVYKKSCIFVYEGLPIWKKGYFKYVKAYW